MFSEAVFTAGRKMLNFIISKQERTKEYSSSVYIENITERENSLPHVIILQF